MSEDKKTKISSLMKKLADLPAEKREELSLQLGRLQLRRNYELYN